METSQDAFRQYSYVFYKYYLYNSSYETNYYYYIKHSFFKTNMDNTADKNEGQSTILKKSYLHQTNHLNPENQDALDNIFLANINCSYLAQLSAISVQQQIAQNKKQPEHEQLKEDKKNSLVQFKEVDTSDGKAEYDLRGDWQFFEIVALKEQGQKDYELQSKPFLFCCDTSNRRLICKAILYDSHFELFSKNPDKPTSQLELFYAINFDTINAKVECLQQKMGGQLILKTQRVKLILKPVEPVVQYWFKQLQKAISKSKGRDCSLTALDCINSFYKNRYETQSYFTNNCKNGDILLFQDNHFMAKVQRFITRSEYDHVGMVIRDKKHGILIFQSNLQTGVCLTPWKYVIKFEWYKNIPKIAWRRLEIDRPLEFDIKLQEFVLKSLPLRFHFSFSKLAAQQSFIMVEEPQRDVSSLNTNQTNGYFCSELIAKTYKHLGLLAQKKQSPNYLPSSRFYPKDFSQRVELNLQKGQLMQQRQIIFDREILKYDYNME